MTATDPVRGMTVESGAPATLQHEGTTFCSVDRKEELEEHPEDHVGA